MQKPWKLVKLPLIKILGIWHETVSAHHPPGSRRVMDGSSRFPLLHQPGHRQAGRHVPTSPERVRSMDCSIVMMKGYEYHGIDMSSSRIPLLYATCRKGAKYDCKSDFKVATKIIVEAIY